MSQRKATLFTPKLCVVHRTVPQYQGRRSAPDGATNCNKLISSIPVLFSLFTRRLSADANGERRKAPAGEPWGLTEFSGRILFRKIKESPAARHTVPPLWGKQSFKHLFPVIAARCAALRCFCLALNRETFTQICSFCHSAALSRYSEVSFPQKGSTYCF